MVNGASNCNRSSIFLIFFLIVVFIFGVNSIENSYGPSPTPPSEANLSITTEINSNTITNGLVIQNQNFNYTITVTNAGPNSASDVEVVTILPSQLSPQNVNATCTLSSQTKTCQLGTIASGGTKIIELEVTPASLGGIIQKSNVTSSTFDKTPQGFAYSSTFLSLNSAAQVAVDSSNNVYVGETASNILYKYNIHGTQLASRSGSFLGQLSGIDFDSSGNVLVADRVSAPNDRVTKFDSGLNVINLNYITSGITAAPIGLATNSTGHIFVTVPDTDDFRIFNEAGTHQQTVTVTSGNDGDTVGPRGIAVNGTHIVVVDRDSDDGQVEIFDLSGNNVGEIGVTSDEAVGSGSCQSKGRLSNPDSVEIDAAGNIYIGSFSCGSVQVYDSSLNSIFNYGIGVTSGITEFFNRVTSIALNGTGWLYVADNTDDKVGLLQPIAGVSRSLPGTVLASTPSEGDFIQSITEITDINGIVGSTFDFAEAVAVNSSGEIFVVDHNDNVVEKFDSNGVFQSHFISGLNSPDGIAIDSNGRIIVVDQDSHTVQVFTSSGANVTSAMIGTVGTSGNSTSLLNTPNDVAVDSSNNIYIVDKANDVIKVYTSAGSWQQTIDGGSQGGTRFGQPEGIAIDSDNRLIISDSAPTSGNDNVQIFSSSLTFVQSITDATGAGGTFNDPQTLSTDSHNRIYVGDSGNDRVQIFDSAGTFEKSISVASGVAPTTFGSVPGLTVDSNNKIYVADGDNDRVQIFKALDAPPVTETTSSGGGGGGGGGGSSSDPNWSTYEQEYYDEIENTPDETVVLEGEEYEEAVFESLATPISPPVEEPVVETFEDVAPPEKVEETVEDTSFKRLSKSDDKEDDAKKMGLEYKEGDVRALVVLDGVSDDVINEIEKFANIESANEDFVQVNVPLDDLSTLYKVPTIKKIQPTTKAIQNSILTQGYDIISANVPHSAGVQGDGIKIAILDLAFDVDNEEIADNVSDSKSFRHDWDEQKIPLSGLGHEAVHGTAVAEIVLDIAPNSELFLYTFASEVEFLDAMDYAMKNDVNLITMSAGWVNYPTDGSSEMTHKVEEAINKGIPFVVSAGNYAQTHWEGPYVDEDSNGWHEFAPSDEGISVVASSGRVSSQIPFVLYLMWDSPTGKVYDFDLSLTDESGNEVAYSANLQESSDDILFEYVYFTPEKSGTYSLGILYDGDDSPDATLEIFSPSDKLEYPVPVGSVSVPTDAKGIISVGALNYYDSRLEPFSSQGPTNHCVQSPVIMAPDAVTTLAYGNDPFFGTSAAAPHVAGMVALMIDKNDKLTPLDILSELTHNSNTDFSDYTEVDNVFGYGYANSGFISELDEVVDPITLEDGCVIAEKQASIREGELLIQSMDPEPIVIPEWVKRNASLWAKGSLTDDTFANAVEHLIEKEIMSIPLKANVSINPDDKDELEMDPEPVPIPDWIKDTASWWVDGSIDDGTFVFVLEYLIEKKIIDV